MQTPQQAILWELWRTSRWEMLGRLCAAIGLILLVQFAEGGKPSAAQGLDVANPQSAVIRVIVLLVFMGASLTSSSWIHQIDNRQMGFSMRLGFTRPVSTRHLVLIPLLYNIAVAELVFLVPASVFQWTTGMALPIAGPVTFIAFGVVCATAATWAPTTTLGKVLGCSLLFLVVTGVPMAYHELSDSREPVLIAMSRPGFFDLTWVHRSFLAVVGGVALGATLVAVDRQRHGESGLIDFRWTPPKLWLPRWDWQMTGPTSAQIWFEFHRFGQKIVLAGAGVALVAFLAITIGRLFRPDLDQAVSTWLILLSLTPLMYQVIGANQALGIRMRQGAYALSPFDAARPMRSDWLIALKLLVIAATSLTGWLLLATGALLQTAMFGEWAAWGRLADAITEVVGEVPLYWWILGSLNILFAYICSCSVLLAMGLWFPLYANRFVWLMVAGYGMVVLALWDAKNGWRLQPFWVALGWLTAAVIVAGSMYLIARAVSSNALGKRYLGVAAGLWGGYVVSVALMYRQVANYVDVPTVLLVLGAAALLIPLATTAAAPLALSSNRHR